MTTNPHPIPAEQRRQLAVMAHTARRHSHDGPPWDVPGIEAAIERCGGAPCDIIAALFALAGDPNARTPGLLPRPGKHWPVIGGERGEPARSYNMRCHDHPDQVMPCATCRAEMVPATASQIAGHMAAIRAATASGLATIKDERERIRARGAA